MFQDFISDHLGSLEDSYNQRIDTFKTKSKVKSEPWGAKP